MKYDWDKIRDEYIYGHMDETGQREYPSLGKLAEKHNIPLGTVKSRARRESWSKQREKAQLKLQEKIMDARAESVAEDMVKADMIFEQTAMSLTEVIMKKITQMDQDINEKRFIRAIELSNTATALKNAQEVLRTAQGEDVNRVSLEVADAESAKREREERARKIQEYLKRLREAEVGAFNDK